MNDLIETNAVITGANLNTRDFGVLTAWIDLDYGGSGQSFGGFSLYLPKGYKHHKMNSPAGHFIYRVMEVAGVSKWSEVVGKTVRVRYNHNYVWSIGHIIKDDWFCPTEDFAAMGDSNNL